MWLFLFQTKNNLYEILNTSPASFVTTAKKLCIYDDNNKDFYYHTNTAGMLNFNLPTGKYFTDQQIFKKPFFTPYVSDVPTIPIEKKIIRNIKISFGVNKNKATIYRDDLRVLIDTQFYKDVLWYVPAMAFLLCHELSHFVIPDYSDMDKRESACDKNGRGLMYSLGFNPIQVTIAAKMLLTNDYRKNCIEHSDTGTNFRK